MYGYPRRKRDNRRVKPVDDIESYDSGEGVGWVRDQGQPDSIPWDWDWAGHHKSRDKDGTEHITEYWLDGSGKSHGISFSRPPPTPSAATPPETLPNESGGSGTTPPATTDDPNRRKTTKPDDQPPPGGRYSEDYAKKLRAEAEKYARNATFDSLDALRESAAVFENSTLPKMVNISVDAVLDPLMEAVSNYTSEFLTAAGIKEGLRSIGFGWAAEMPSVVKGIYDIADAMSNGTLTWTGTKLKAAARAGLTWKINSVLEVLDGKPRTESLRANRRAIEEFRTQADIRARHQSEPETARWMRTGGGPAPYDPRRPQPIYDDPVTPWDGRPRGGGRSYYGYGGRFHKPYPLTHRRWRRSAYVFSR